RALLGERLERIRARVKLRWTRLSDAAQPPAPAHPGDAGYDLRAAEPARIEPGARASVGTGVAVEIPDGHAGLVLPRSGLAARRAPRAHVRRLLEAVVGARLELDPECELDHAVGEPHVLGQQRSVQVRADDVSAVHTLGAVAAVVAVSLDHAAEWLLVVAQIG